MKKIFTTALALLAFKTAILAQTVTAVGIVTLTGAPSTPMEVAYNPTFNLYYASSGGGPCNNLSTWSAVGGSPLATISECYDSRGLWWNSLTNTLEGNSYNSAGIYTMALSGAGIPTGVGAIASTNQQPNAQVGGQFDPTTNQVVYYSGGGNINKYSRSTGLLVSTITITGLPVAISNLASYGFYTGITGAEYAVYDYINRRAYLINYTTGAYVSTVQFPATAGTPSTYNLSYCNGLYFICNGTTWVGYATIGSALNFDKTAPGDNVLLPSAISTSLSTSNKITVEAWVRPTNLSSLATVVGNYANPGNQMQFLMRALATNYQFLIGNSTTGGYFAINSSVTPTLNVWQHIAGVWNGTVSSIYVNGVLTGTVGITFTSLGVSTNSLIIGGNSINENFAGDIDEVRIWNRALCQPEIQNNMVGEIATSSNGLLANYHFNQGIPLSANPTATTLIDASGNAYTGTLTGVALTGTTSNWVSPGAVGNGALAPAFISPTIAIAGLNTICLGASTTFTASGNVNAYVWTAGPNTSTYAVTPTVTTTYSVVGTNSLGCISNITTQTLTVNSNPTVTVNSGVICSGNSFTIVPSGASTYTISGGSAIVTPSANANYNVTGTSSLGCVSSNTAVSSVTVNATPSVSVTSGAICAGNSFTMVGSGASTYTFSSGSAVVTPTANANYNVTGTSAQGCVSSNTAVSSVTVNALPTVTATSNLSVLCTGFSSTLTANGASTYTWNTSATTAVIVISPTVTTTYTVNGTNAAGCANVTTVTQSVSTCVGINALTSNLQSAINVYPNPTTGVFTIELANASNVSVVDVLGKVIYSEKLQDGKYNINISNFNNGLYILKAESNGVVKTVRLVKD